MRQFSKTSATAPGKELIAGEVATITAKPGEPASVVMRNGPTSPGSCLNCPDTPCVHFADSEITSPVLSSFPFNRSREVCPFDALAADTVRSLPVINVEKCVGCGLCISRCPAGALYTSPTGVATLNDEPNGVFRARAAFDAKSHADAVVRLGKASRVGEFRAITSVAVDRTVKKAQAARLSPTKEKLFVRNLFLCLGVEAAISTVGDTNVRIDLWFEAQDKLWLTEVDFDEVSLVDSPRDLLADVAVCVSRHNVARDKIGAAIVCIQFPNKRADFYHLVEDFEVTVNLGVRTISVAGLLLLLWLQKCFDDIDFDQCLATRGDESIASAFEALLERKARGVLESQYFMAIK